MIPIRKSSPRKLSSPRLASLGTTPSQGPRPGRGPRRGVEDLEAALEQFREAPGILLPTCLQRKNSTCAIDFGIALNQYITSQTFPADRYASLPFRCL